MKRLVACLMILAFAMTGAVGISAEEAEKSMYVEFAEGVGIMDKTDEAKDTELTRGDFAELIYRLVCGADGGEKAEAWYENTFAEDAYNTEITISGNAVYFDDVLESDSYYDAVFEMNRLKIMMGTGTRTFSPTKTITYAEAATAMVRLLGYDIYAKNSSYWQTASSLDLFKGMKPAQSEALTKGGAAQMLYNCLDINLLEIKISKDREVQYQPYEGKTIYSEFMDLYETKGLVESTPVTSIYNADGAGENKALIANVKYDVSRVPEIYNYIGRDVKLYYQDREEDDCLKVLYFRLSGKDTAEVISAADFESVDGYSISYYNNNRLVTKKMQTGATVIYNGILKTDYTAADFDIENGDITIIKTADSQSYNIAVINNYISYTVSDINKTKQMISAKRAANSNVKSFDLSEEAVEAYKCMIYTASGEKTDFSAISVGSVIDVSENNGYCKIIVSSEKIAEFTVISVSTDEDYIEIASADGTIYKIPKKYYENTKNDKPVLNGTYSLRLNSFGEVCYVEKVTSKAGKELAYIISATPGEDESYVGRIKYFNMKGSIIRKDITNEMKLVLSDGKKMRIKDENDFNTVIANMDGVTIAELIFDEAGNLTQLTLPQEKTGVRDGELGCFVNNRKVQWSGVTSPTFFEDAMLSDDTVIINVDTSQTDEKKRYTIINKNSLKDGNEYTISAFNYSEDSVIADCIIMTDAASESWGTRTQTVYLIDNVSRGIDDDDEEVVRAEAYKITYGANAEKVELISDIGILDKAETFFDQNAGIKLKKGDVIVCEIFDGRVERAIVAFEIFNQSKKTEPNIIGTIGYYSADKNTLNTNPFSIKDAEPTSYKESAVNRVRSGYMRFFAANAYNIENNKFLTYTSQPIDKGSSFDKTRADTKYLTETTVLPSKNMVVVTGNYKNMTVSNAAASDIKTYMNAGAKCSKLFMVQRYGRIYSMIIVNTEE